MCGRTAKPEKTGGTAMSTLTSTRIAFDKELRFIQIHVNENPYWEYVTRTNSAQGVTIVAVTRDKKIVLVKQHRIPLGVEVVELPAGLVGDKNTDERPEDAVAKELLEETGYHVEPANIRLLAKGPALAGLTDEVNGLYLATEAAQLKQGGGIAGEGEKIETLALPLATVLEDLQKLETDKCLVDLKVYAGLYYLSDAQRSSDSAVE